MCAAVQRCSSVILLHLCLGVERYCIGDDIQPRRTASHVAQHGRIVE